MSKCQINGMYAFVLYDNATDTFIVARDPIGIIPLYIGYGKDGSIWFASEMKALQEHCDHFELFPTGHYMVGKSLGRFKILKQRLAAEVGHRVGHVIQVKSEG